MEQVPIFSSNEEAAGNLYDHAKGSSSASSSTSNSTGSKYSVQSPATGGNNNTNSSPASRNKPSANNIANSPLHRDPINAEQMMLNVHYWTLIEQFAVKHFTCGLCRSLLTDPRKLLTGDGSNETYVCQKCAAGKDLQSTEAPSIVVAAATDLRAMLSSAPLPDDETTAANIKRFIGTNKALNPQSGRNNTKFEPQVDFFKKQKPESGSKVEYSNESLRNKITHVISEEEQTRSKISEEQTKIFCDFQKSNSQGIKSIKSSRPGCSKQLKILADENYEQANYALAIDYYNKSIAKASDGTTRYNVLYGNRSAALFMSMQYQECIDDCMRVISSEPNNVKMYLRAIKAAIMMGDLEKALDLHKKVPKSIVTDQMQADFLKLQKAVEELREAKKKQGTDEGNRLWELLMTKFSETLVFRINLAESMANAGRLDNAIEVLSVIMPPSRPASIALRIAKYYYLSGFEQFDRARETLMPYLADSSCAEFMQLLNAVDDEKQTGNQLFSNRKFAESVEHYTRAIELDLTNGRILRILYCNRAAAFKELNKLKEGVEDCTKAISLDPAFSKAYARRARCLLLQREFDAAVRDFKKASECDKNDADLKRELTSAEEALAREIEKEKDFYYVLGATRNSTEAEIKTKYRALSLRYHPDKCMGNGEFERQVAERKFKAIAEAYSVLSAQDKRREYDLKCDRERFARPFDTNYTRNAASKYTRTRHNAAGGYTYGTAATGANNYW